MKIKFEFDDNTEKTVLLEGELLDALAVELGYYMPSSGGLTTPKDHFVINTITADLTNRVAGVLKQKAIQSRQAEIDDEVSNSLNGLNG